MTEQHSAAYNPQHGMYAERTLKEASFSKLTAKIVHRRTHELESAGHVSRPLHLVQAYHKGRGGSHKIPAKSASIVQGSSELVCMFLLNGLMAWCGRLAEAMLLWF